MGLRVVTVPGKREMVNPTLGLGLVWWRSIPKLLPAFPHILWSTGPNYYSEWLLRTKLHARHWRDLEGWDRTHHKEKGQ